MCGKNSNKTYTALFALVFFFFLNLELQTCFGTTMYDVGSTASQNTVMPSKTENTAIAAEISGYGKFTDNMAILSEPQKEILIDFKAENKDAVSETSAPSKGAMKVEISSSEKIDISVSQGEIIKAASNRLVYKAPEKPGLYKINIEINQSQKFSDNPANTASATDNAKNAKLTLNVLVGYPYNPESNGVIEGYPIGIYPDENSQAAKSIVAGHKDNYAPPKFFYKITSENENLRVSPNFVLADFSNSAEKGKDRFIAVNYRLINRLEELQTLLSQKGLAHSKIKIIRGYVSPNDLNILRKKGIKLSEFTRYQYGDAAAIIVDENSDGIMDDITNDGVADINDIKILEESVKDIELQSRIYGGIGVFDKFEDISQPSTPYLHLDLRGFSSRF